MTLQVRIARPVGDLARSVRMYRDGLGMRVIGEFADHAGFDGAMLTLEGQDFHFEFTRCNAHPVTPRPTPEDLVVLYLPEATDWRRRCQSLSEVGFREIEPFNDYWKTKGRSFQDPDGYIVVVQQASWRE